MEKECPMCASEEVEIYRKPNESKTLLICYACYYIEVTQRYYMRTREEEDLICEAIEDGKI